MLASALPREFGLFAVAGDDLLIRGNRVLQRRRSQEYVDRDVVVKALLGRAEALQTVGNSDLALNDIDQVLAWHPTHPQALALRTQAALENNPPGGIGGCSR